MCATSPTERIFQPKIILVIRGQGIPQNSHHEIDIMQEIIGGGGHTHKMAASVWDGDSDRSGCDGGLCRGMEQAHREKAAWWASVPLAISDGGAVGTELAWRGTWCWNVGKDSWRVSEHPTLIVFLVSSYGNNKHSEIFIATVIYENTHDFFW